MQMQGSTHLQTSGQLGPMCRDTANQNYCHRQEKGRDGRDEERLSGRGHSQRRVFTDRLSAEARAEKSGTENRRFADGGEPITKSGYFT